MVALRPGSKPVQTATYSSDDEEETYEQLALIATSKGDAAELARGLLADREDVRPSNETQKKHQHDAMLKSSEHTQIEGTIKNKVSAGAGGMYDCFRRTIHEEKKEKSHQRDLRKKKKNMYNYIGRKTVADVSIDDIDSIVSEYYDDYDDNSIATTPESSIILNPKMNTNDKSNEKQQATHSPNYSVVDERQVIHNNTEPFFPPTNIASFKQADTSNWILAMATSTPFPLAWRRSWTLTLILQWLFIQMLLMLI